MKRAYIHPLTAAGLIIVVFAAAALAFTPALYQFAFLPAGNLRECVESAGRLGEAMGDEALVTTLHGVKTDSSVSGADGAGTDDVTLYLCADRYNEVYPRRVVSGELLSPFALKQGGDCAVIDEGLAFLLFGDSDPLNGTVSVEGKEFRVTGVAKHSRLPGEKNRYAAWVPMLSLEETECDILVSSMASKLSSPLLTRFENAAREVFTDQGTAFSLHKERMRAGMALRFVALCLSVRLMMMWVKRLKAIASALREQIRLRLKVRYLRESIPFVAVRALACLALTALTLGAAYGLLVFFLEPATVFVEWVPDKLVSFASIAERFWELTSQAGKPVSFVTAELARVRLLSSLLHFGAVCALTGLALGRRGRRPDALHHTAP